MRITLSTTALVLSFLLISCSARQSGDDTDNSNSPTENGSSGLGTSGGLGGDGDSEESVAGLWDFSDLVETIYEYWTDNGVITTYDYQGDGTGSGQNCYETFETQYTREGSEITFDNSSISNVTRDANTLTVDGIPYPLITSITIADLEVCI